MNNRPEENDMTKSAPGQNLQPGQVAGPDATTEPKGPEEAPKGANAGTNETGPVAAAPSSDVEEWAIKINQAADFSTSWKVRAGTLLIRADEALGRKKWRQMFDDGAVRFGLRNAQMHMAVARHPAFKNAKYISQLPSSMTTLYALRKLSPEAIERGILNGTIHTELKAAEARRLVQAQVSGPAGLPKPSPKAFDTVREQGRVLRFLRAQLTRWPATHHEELGNLLQQVAAELRSKCKDKS